MKNNDFIKKLENLELPEVELPSHQRRLKVALLNSGYSNKKQFIMTTLLKKFAIPVGAVALVAVIAVMSLGGGNSTAYAKEIAQKSYQVVENMPAEQRAALEKQLGESLKAILQEALAAEDLEVLTYDEYTSTHPLPPALEGNRSLKFLGFSRDDGRKVFLGVDENNVPVPLFAFGVGIDKDNMPEGVTPVRSIGNPDGMPAGNPTKTKNWSE